MIPKILYLRNFASKVNGASYNLQEVGLGKALVRKGYDCDIVYYNDRKETHLEQVYRHAGCTLRIIWLHGFKFLSNSIYRDVLKDSFLAAYDLVITTEYNQIMTYLLSRKCPDKLALYHGPYRDNTHALIRKLYDVMLLPKVTKSLRRTYVKSDLAKRYLENKGFDNVITIGVGLDRSNVERGFNSDDNSGAREENREVANELRRIGDRPVLLYVGVLEERRNIRFMLSTFKRVLQKHPGCLLLMVGNGRKIDTDRYWAYAQQLGLTDRIIHFPRVEQRHLWQIYGAADVMLFPTQYDIFGMVLLESMLFRVPIISSVNGGSVTLIEDGVSGVMLRSFSEEEWAGRIGTLLEDAELRQSLAEKAFLTIERMSWDRIADEIVSQQRIKPMSSNHAMQSTQESGAAT
ncbi:glycosyltransferase family 4 protein [Paenibacillus polymyxa]|uniref:Glycosyl transferase n=1 Tax=Paenibacillus polymyxa (strain SC2) TaxID=886882 RepID=E3EGX3_PAEPS|nr:glycosyltransferase family 4 protein [Paenibacillus polymyxa]ADO55207.1 glycosyl transferase [Paenibacillus polymyxa SC2]AJE50636.1 glycosyl transferase [Paenibacillus polymyxa]QOH60979.1 glycosyl transferase [Paenibacillus polymyxa]WPQ59330.1 glycosyltransferase family 4 protein [Paenibacillus polymyxa]